MNDELLDPVNFLAISFLDSIGVNAPSEQIINKTELLLSNVVINQHIFFDNRLNKQECACLFLAAKGKTTEETASTLSTTPTIIESWRRNIKRKLNSSNMTQAVFEGMRFGYIQTNA